MTNNQYLLNDKQIYEFIINGYLILNPKFPKHLNEKIYQKADALDTNPGDNILDEIPDLNEIWSNPKVKGVLQSLLGINYTMNPHRHCHMNEPGSVSQTWHQDGLNERHHEIKTVLGMYYPQKVTNNMGPTAIVPGTHFRNAPSDRLATYGNFKDQVLGTVEAGSIIFLHYDIWHAATSNTSDKTRYMFKFLFNKNSKATSETVSPSWNHDTSEAIKHFGLLLTTQVCRSAQSDFYKEKALREKMWDSMTGGIKLNVSRDAWAGKRRPKKNSNMM